MISGVVMRIWLGLALALAVGQPCAAERVKVELPSPLASTPLPSGTKTAPVSLTRLAANIAPGTPWAAENRSIYFMAPCVGEGEVSIWEEANNKIASKDSFDRIFRGALKDAGFNAGGDPQISSRTRHRPIFRSEPSSRTFATRAATTSRW
jgi:hypothetical protein